MKKAEFITNNCKIITKTVLCEASAVTAAKAKLLRDHCALAVEVLVNNWKMVWIVRPQDLHTDLNLSDKTVVRRRCGWLYAGSVVMSELCHTTWAVMVCGLSAFVRFIRLTEYLQTAQQHSRRMWPDPLWQTDTELHFSMGHLAQWDLQTLPPRPWVLQGLSETKSL